MKICYGKHRPVAPLILFTLLCFLLYISVVWLNMTLSADVVYAPTLLPLLTQGAYQAVELIAFFVSYAAMLFLLFHFGHKKTVAFFLAYAVLTISRQIVLVWIERSMFISSFDTATQMWFGLSNALLELAQLGVVAIICVLCVRRFDRAYSVLKQGAAQLSGACPPRASLVYPAKKGKKFKDPIRSSALGIALLVSATRIVGRAIYDAMLGAPTTLADVLWMVLYYTLDILFGVACYFFVLIFFSKATQKLADG